MNLTKISRLRVTRMTRYLVRPFERDTFLITHNYRKLNIIDVNFNIKKTILFEKEELISLEYFSDDKRHLLWDSEGEHLSYVNFDQQDLKPAKLIMPENISLDQYYVWDEDKFIIAGRLGRNEYISFFAYNVQMHTLDEISCDYILKKYSFFRKVFEYNLYNYLLYYNIKKEILVYRRVKEDGDEIFFRSPSDKRYIESDFTEKDVHGADYLDGFLVLVHETYLIFYYLGTELFHINMTKKNWAFRSAHLFKRDNDFYCLVSQFDLCNPRRNIVEVYKIE